jgi:hypothetical protein
VFVGIYGSLQPIPARLVIKLLQFTPETDHIAPIIISSFMKSIKGRVVSGHEQKLVEASE